MTDSGRLTSELPVQLMGRCKEVQAAHTPDAREGRLRERALGIAIDAGSICSCKAAIFERPSALTAVRSRLHYVRVSSGAARGPR